MGRLYLLGSLIPLLQVACALHAYKHGKERFWYYVILLFPVAGSIVYLAAEVAPTLRIMGDVVNWVESIPWFRSREMDRLEDELEYAPTIDNRLKLASACMRHGHSQRAVELYRECLKGAHKQDLDIMRGLAEALCEHEDWKGLIELTADLRPLVPEREVNDAVRWEAIALDGLDRHAEAEERYRHLVELWPGEEIRCRLASMLARQGRTAEARKEFEILQRHLRRGNSYYRRQNREWAKSTTAWLKHLEQTSA